MSGPMGYAVPYMSVPDDPKIKELTERRIAVKQALVDALFNYLTFEDRVTLETFGTHTPYVHKFTLEDLARAQSDCEMVATRVAQLEDSLGSLPEHARPIVEVTMLAPMEQELQSRRDFMSRIQESLEQQAKESGQ